jgi:hypothetical protein
MLALVYGRHAKDPDYDGIFPNMIEYDPNDIRTKLLKCLERVHYFTIAGRPCLKQILKWAVDRF